MFKNNLKKQDQTNYPQSIHKLRQFNMIIWQENALYLL